MVPTGTEAKGLLSVNHTTKTIHRHHHRHHHHHHHIIEIYCVAMEKDDKKKTQGRCLI